MKEHAQELKTAARQGTRRFGFNDTANLDEGAMWPTRLRPDRADRRRRGKDRCAREKKP